MTTPREERGVGVAEQTTASGETADDCAAPGTAGQFRFNSGAIDGRQELMASVISAKAGFGKVPALVTTSTLSDAAIRLLVFALTCPPNWIPLASDLQARFGWGEDKYQKARQELEAAGIIERGHERFVDADGVTKSRHSLNFDVQPVLLLPQRLRPPPKSRGSRAPARTRTPQKPVVARAPEKLVVARSQGKPVLNKDEEARETTTGDGLPAAANPPASEEEGAAGALAAVEAEPLEALRSAAQAAGLQVSASALRSASAAASCATAEQMEALRSAAAGAAADKIKNHGGWLVAMARRACAGELEAQQVDKKDPNKKDPWPARRALAGAWAAHPLLGRIEVSDEPAVWLTPAGCLAGARSLRLWAEVESGAVRLTERPPRERERRSRP